MKFATCHKNRKLFCKNLCKPCYKKQYNTLETRQPYNTRYYQENKEKLISQHYIYNQNNQPQIKSYHKKRYQNKKLEIQTKIRLHYQRNRQRYNRHNNQYQINRRKTDLEFKLKTYLRIRCWQVITNKRLVKSDKTLKLLGCTVERLKFHLESKFQPNMSWSNYGKGGWEIDHKIPCALFNLVDPKEQRKCFHYSNLQPLWARDNRAKSCSIG